ncbi:MAG TPA: amino acid permease [Bacteroidetes bacterium]|nr:MAG: amino acid permease [Bacteroidota bacterium]RLD70954.1 MAG: amino acid permease [Bacteroidota bacterium]HHL57814.1 amino acid permease [Bacteroidota bacterium]
MTHRKTNTKFGTAPVFFTAISTILGAILFLRFGFAVGTVGFWGAILIILLGHMVTIPTALAISEIATNKRVEGGGEYFIISRSFGINIGATIGIALFMSQAISVAFYVIAFTEAFDFVFSYVHDAYGFALSKQAISIPSMMVLAVLILTKGANLGVKALYVVVVILAASLVLFFLGDTAFATQNDFNIFKAQFRNSGSFFVVFAIIFPAFTGMTAGVGLSGDLKKPSRSIPIGTISATVIGMIIYFFLVYKFAVSASPEDLMGNQLIMRDIAIYGAIAVPLGLAASTISSALGSVMVAPRTLQALAMDRAFPVKPLNNWLARGRKKDGEPFNASLVTVTIAMVFVALGNINSVASIISMFFMVTYGSLCLISFLNHFGSSPAYRPSFRSRWYLSLMGFIVSLWVMFKINTPYALLAFALMTGVYLYMQKIHKNRRGFASIFSNAIFQLNRNLQVYLQKKQTRSKFREWRPSAICISKDSFERDKAFRLLSWIAYKYGFGTYLHRIEGYYSKETRKQSEEELKRLIQKVKGLDSHVYVDTLISPSYTSAIAQAIQIPGIAGMENNMVIFEYGKNDLESLTHILENFALVNAGNFDVIILANHQKKIEYKNGIHLWIKSTDTENANLMILLSFIILGHPDWDKGDIKIFNICKPVEEQETKDKMHELVVSGRLPITANNINIILSDPEISSKQLVNKHSKEAGITMIGFREERIKREKEEVFEGYDQVGTIMFVHSHDQKIID